MDFLKRCLLVGMLLFITHASYAQVNKQLNIYLNLSPELVFGRHVNIFDVLKFDRLKNDSVTQAISHANESIADLLHHPMFDNISIELNDEELLVLYNVSTSDKQKTDQYREKIISSLTKNFGPALTNTHGWFFRNGDEYASYTVDAKGGSNLLFGTDKYVHVVEEYNEKEKLTFINTRGHLVNHNEPGLTSGQDTTYFDSFIINFSGVKETKTITLYFTTEHQDIKEISLLMDDGDAVLLKRNKKWRGKPYYYYKFDISRKAADRLFRQNHRIISFKGRYPNKVEIPDDSSTDFDLIYKYLYLN